MVILLHMPGRKILTVTLPSRVVVEKDRFGVFVDPAVAAVVVLLVIGAGAVALDAAVGTAFGGSVLRVLSCKSCAHGRSVGSEFNGPRLEIVSAC